MGGSLAEARKRLPSLDDLEQAPALLSIPGLDDADRNTGALLRLRQAALLDAIASWAGLSARAARETGALDFTGITEQYAYIIETVDEHQRDWWLAGLEDDSGGIEESHDSPETFAVAVMNRYLDHMRDHLDDYEDAIRGELHARVSVWSVRSVTAAYPSTAPDPDRCPPARYRHLLKRSRILPRAVEIRTPLQVHHHVYGGGITPAAGTAAGPGGRAAGSAGASPGSGSGPRVWGLSCWFPGPGGDGGNLAAVAGCLTEAKALAGRPRRRRVTAAFSGLAGGHVV